MSDYPLPADEGDVAESTLHLNDGSSLADWALALGRVLDHADSDWLPLTAIEDALGITEQAVALKAVALGIARRWFTVDWMNAFIATDNLLVVTWAEGGWKRFVAADKKAEPAGEASR